MAKTVMIPSSDQEMWVCRINHKEYSYPQGTEQSVPDEVAELIASINANAVQATPEEQATWEVYSQGGWITIPNELPDSAGASNGDVLSIDNGEPKWTTPASGLPDATSASAGDVLSLDEDKEPVWSTPSGGGGITIADIDYTKSIIPDEEGGSVIGYYIPLNVTLAEGISAFLVCPKIEYKGSGLPTDVNSYETTPQKLYPSEYDDSIIGYKDFTLYTMDETGTLYYYVDEGIM